MARKDKYDLDGLIEHIRIKPLPYDVEDNYKRLQKNIREDNVFSVNDKNYQLWKIIGIAASVALLIVTTLHFVNLDSNKETIWYEVTAVPDAKTKVVLPDSSTVWLNANASLRYPQSFNENKRNVEIKGDAIFDIRKDDRPFLVQLEGLKIKVLGTVFNVLTDKHDQIEITLLEGKIALFNDENKTEIPNEVLVPNQQAIFSQQNKMISVTPIRTEAITSWMTGQFSFEGNTLLDITAELERAFHTKIHIENEEMKSKTFNAVFSDKETLEEILAILQISARYTIEKRKGEIYIN